MPPSKPHIELIARAVLTRGPWLLACKNLKANYYYLPGGHIEFGESAPTALAREFQEEAGIRVKIGPLLLTTEGSFRTKKTKHHEINLVFHVEQSDGRSRRSAAPPPPIRSREKHIAFDWLDLRAIADQDLRPAGIRAWLATWHAAGSRGICSTWNSEF